MKRTYVSCLALGLVLGSAGLCHAGPLTDITFDEPGLVPGFGPFGTPVGSGPVTNQFAALGLVFSIDAFGVDYITAPAFVGGLAGPSGGNVLAVNTVPFNSNPATTLTATFVDPSGSGLPATVDGSTLSVFVCDTNAAPSPRVIVRSFDVNGNLLEEQDLLVLGATLRFSAGRVHRVQFYDNGGDGHTIDDFSFGPLTVAPEPSTLALLGTGGLGLLAYSWQRRNRTVLRRPCSWEGCAAPGRGSHSPIRKPTAWVAALTGNQ